MLDNGCCGLGVTLLSTQAGGIQGEKCNLIVNMVEPQHGAVLIILRSLEH